MKLGVYTAVLHDRPLREALMMISVVGLGRRRDQRRWLPADAAPSRRGAVSTRRVEPAAYLEPFVETGIEFTGLNVNGNPLHADPEVGPEDAEDLRRAIRLAGHLGVQRVVTMSGLPAAPSRRSLARVARKPLGQRLSRLARISVGRCGCAVLARDRRIGPRSRRQGMHRDAPAESRVQPANAAAAGGQDPVPLTSALRWTLVTCSGRASTRLPPSTTWATWCSMPPQRTPGSTRPAPSMACSTTDSPGSRQANSRPVSAGGTPSTGGRKTPAGTSSPSAAATTSTSGRSSWPPRPCRPRHGGQHRARGRRARPVGRPRSRRVNSLSRERRRRFSPSDTDRTRSPDLS